MSSKYAILASPGHIVSTSSRTSQVTFGGWPRTGLAPPVLV
ncbi:hypothetical protein [Tunturiibacter gelidoferens]|uniref:Uncharacterized protein n=1 Tax=Tunturiibacter gelidiferens TaxID=3069689 RepID=A0A9X0QGR0_9BACT|nr:hypothetical protein [Edaphobacter lichenicola]MBB5329959.1 hypothetical protein [Edaphobacter lichenicola]